jgi:hypothetical protein
MMIEEGKGFLLARLKLHRKVLLWCLQYVSEQWCSVRSFSLFFPSLCGHCFVGSNCIFFFLFSPLSLPLPLRGFMQVKKKCNFLALLPFPW